MNIVQRHNGYSIQVNGVNVSVRAVRSLIQWVDNPIARVEIVREFTGLGLLESRNIVNLVGTIVDMRGI